MARAWLMPEGRGCALYEARGGVVVRGAEISAEAKAAWAVEPGRELLCWAVKGGVVVRRGGQERRIGLARGFEVHALALREEVLYVGGGRMGEQLGRVDLRAATPGFEAMEIPARLRSHGKSIDAFVLDGDRMLALDDFLDPKWFLLYDVSEPRAPRYLEARSLDPDSTGHVIHAAALAERHVAVASTSYNHGRASVRLELFERESLEIRGSMHAHAREQIGRRGVMLDASGREFAHVDALGERLLLAAGHEGLAVGELGGIDPPGAPRRERFDPSFTQRMEAALRWSRFAGLAVVRGFLLDAERALISLRDARARHEVRVVALP